MKGCCCSDHGHSFEIFEGEERCVGCGYYMLELLEHTNVGSLGAGGNCLTCGVKWPCPYAEEKS